MRANGDTIRWMRESRRMTVRDLAALVGISHQFLSRIEREERGAETETFERIANVLDTTVRSITVREASRCPHCGAPMLDEPVPVGDLQTAAS